MPSIVVKVGNVEWMVRVFIFVWVPIVVWDFIAVWVSIVIWTSVPFIPIFWLVVRVVIAIFVFWQIYVPTKVRRIHWTVRGVPFLVKICLNFSQCLKKFISKFSLHQNGEVRNRLDHPCLFQTLRLGGKSYVDDSS